MADIQDMTPGEVLTDASVAEFIKVLGLSIAEAQRALDENSVDQMGEFLVPRASLGGKSLLDMGLMPAFYHYQHADITCSMQLSLRVERDLSVGLQLAGSYGAAPGGVGDVGVERYAIIDVAPTAEGTITIGGQEFQLTGDDPLTRMQGLQRAVTSDERTGVSRLLYRESARTFDIRSAAVEERVRTTKTSIAFQGAGFSRAIIQIATDEDTEFEFGDEAAVVTTAQGSLGEYADHVLTEIKRTKINDQELQARLVGPGQTLLKAYFETGRHHLEEFSAAGKTHNRDYATEYADLAGFIRTNGLGVEVEGYGDARPDPEPAVSTGVSNRALALRRAAAVQKLLEQHGVDPAHMTVRDSQGPGEGRGGGSADDRSTLGSAELRIIGQSKYYLYCRAPEGEEFGSLKPEPESAAAGNAFIFHAQPTSLELAGSVTINGTSFSLRGAAAGSEGAGPPASYAANLRDDINANSDVNFVASAQGNVVTVFGKNEPFRVELYTSETRPIQLEGSSGVTIRQQFDQTAPKALTRPSTGNRAVAVGASLDVRFGRQFGMGVTGNSSISARLVSIPAPPQFLQTIRDFLADRRDG